MTGPAPSRASHRRRRPPTGVLLRRWAVVLSVVALLLLIVTLLTGAFGSPASRRASQVPTVPGGSRTPAPGVTDTTARAAAARRPAGGAARVVPPASVTIAAVGDTELGNTPDLPPDPQSYLQPVQGALAAPVVFGNLEGTLTDATSSKCAPTSSQCYAFRTPPAYAQLLRQAGFTVLNSANNHSHDFGDQGVSDTTAALQSAGIAQAGLPGEIAVVHDGPTAVAFVDFAPYPNVNDLLDLATARTLILRAEKEAPIVVVYMHAGAEGQDADHVTGAEETYVGEDRGNAEAFAHAAVDDGASLVIASGPHVLRGMEFDRGHLIAYSLGDFASYQDFSTEGDLALSVILRVTLSPSGRFLSARLVPLTLDADGRPSVDPAGAATQFVAQLSAQDFGANAASLAPDGTIAPPVTATSASPPSGRAG